MWVLTKTWLWLEKQYRNKNLYIYSDKLNGQFKVLWKLVSIFLYTIISVTILQAMWKSCHKKPSQTLVQTSCVRTLLTRSLSCVFCSPKQYNIGWYAGPTLKRAGLSQCIKATQNMPPKQNMPPQAKHATQANLSNFGRPDALFWTKEWLLKK